MIEFNPMNEHDFTRFLDYIIPEYAADIVSNYRFSEEDALLQARHETQFYLPDGAHTEGQVLLCILANSGNQKQHIGFLWYKPDHAMRSAWIYDFYLFPQWRNKGFGGMALKELERNLLAEGIIQLKLRVAADNPHAKHVYEASGFAVSGFNMNKMLKM